MIARFWPTAASALRVVLLIAPLLLADSPARTLGQEDPFGMGVRPTPYRTPQEQLRMFRLPPGFVIQLVAAEPDLLKPMNLAFDGRGRLWVSMSQEYPYAAPSDRPGKDAIKVIELGPDGSAARIDTFAEGLNIPIGLYPYRNGVIAYSIPNIWFIEDSDNDGVGDRRTKLYGPMGYERDTHGMNNGFRRGFDGWLYACHGFNNETRVAGRDGREIHMQSGNTYRMRLDGESIEHFTWGQVNPFGMALDSLGNLFTADCHSKPIYQLLRGGYYPSFGKPDDGLGFVPPMMDHLHGSTAIAGVACYEADQFPPEFRGELFSGNVMTSRVNRNHRLFLGSTIRCQEQEDFVICDDPWFRPVDVRLGPDGSLYIADFYNRIIGHYEVPLDHPGRDRTSGRIWRISYQGDRPEPPQCESPDFTSLSVEDLIEQLDDANFVRRQLAADQLSDRIGESAVDAVRTALRQGGSPRRRVHCLWTLHRLGALDADLLLRSLQAPETLVRLHAAKATAERRQCEDSLRAALFGLLRDPDAFVRQAAAGALAAHPHPEAVRAILQAAQETSPDDPLLRHALRIAVKQHWLSDALPAVDELPPWDPALLQELARTAVAAPTEQAASFLIEYLRTHGEQDHSAARWLEHAARHAAPQDLAALPVLLDQLLAEDPDRQLELWASLRTGAGRRLPQPAKDWAARLSRRLLESGPPSGWASWPGQQAEGESVWGFQSRQCEDGQSARVVSSIVFGEQRTGALVSPDFPAPPQLTFYLAGHRGFPDQSPHERNLVRLVDSATQRTLRVVYPPRSDVAVRVAWDLPAETQGRPVRLEVVDGDAGDAYAWLAVARLEGGVALPASAPAEESRRWSALVRLAADSEDAALIDDVLRAASAVRDPLVAAAAGRLALERASLTGKPLRAALLSCLSHPDLPAAWRIRLPGLALEPADPLELLREIARSATDSLQVFLAQQLAASREGADVLVGEIQGGRISARVLRDPKLVQLLGAAVAADRRSELVALYEALPAADQELEELTRSRLSFWRTGGGDASQGKRLFAQHCAACHRIGQEGQMVGPQLDGVGKRGAARLIEDTLDPNRNVDVAFRTVILQLADGRVVTGLPRREEGGVLTLADEKGKEFEVRLDAVEERQQSMLSLMPTNVARQLSEREFLDLMAFLLQQ